MNRRTKENIKVIICLGILIVLTVLAVHTFVVGAELALISSDVTEAELKASSHPMMRISADSIYESAKAARNDLCNSSNPYTRFLANMTNDLIRIPFGLFVMLSPYLFLCAVRKYNTYKRRKRRAGK